MTSHVEPTPREGPKALDQEDHSADQASGSCTGKSKIPDQHSNVYGRLCISPDSAHRPAHRRGRTEHNFVPRRCDATGEGLVMGTGGGGQKPKTDGINRKESTKQKRRGWIGGTQKQAWLEKGRQVSELVKEDYRKRLEQELTRKGKEEDGSGRRRSRDAL